MHAISEFIHWARTSNLTDKVTGDLKFLCSLDIANKRIHKLAMYQKIDNGWHSLHISSHKVIVAFNAFHEDTYMIDTTMFSTPITEEEYFQYCTIQDHLHLTEAEFRAIVDLSKFVGEYTC